MTVDLFLTFVCHACQKTRKEKNAVHPMRVSPSYFSWRAEFWHTQPPPSQQVPLSQPAKLLSTLCESTTGQAPRTDPDARTHSHPPRRVSGDRAQPRLVLTAFHPAHRAVTLRWPSHHLKLVCGEQLNQDYCIRAKTPSAPFFAAK